MKYIRIVLIVGLVCFNQLTIASSDAKNKVQIELDKALQATEKGASVDAIHAITKGLVNTMETINEELYDRISDELQDEAGSNYFDRVVEMEALGAESSSALISCKIDLEDEVEIARRFIIALDDSSN